jgi:hypothetical protein
VIDFAAIVRDLRSHFGSVNQLARKLQYGNPDYLRHLERGEITDPRYSVGDRLIELYRKLISESVPEVGGAIQKRLL